MSREIKFRGKSIKTNEFIYGVPIVCRETKKTYILETAKMYSDIQFDCYDFQEVNQKTISQFTGLYDKNGKEIYEGDVVEFTQDESYQTDCGTEYETYISLGEINFNQIRGGYDIWVNDEESWAEDIEDIFNQDDKFKVIGNIYENLELLKKLEKND